MILSKDKAQEEAKKIADRGLITDALATFKATVDKGTGFLTAPVKLARIGVQKYMGYELGLLDRAMDTIGVMRPASEVFHPDSIASFTNLTVTDDHPSEMVTVDNVKKLQKGSVSGVGEDGSYLIGLVTITDKDQITKSNNGKIEVSVGYAHELKEEKGIFDGESYEFIQTNIRANHLAIVDAGRCGSACKLALDEKTKENVVKLTIDGIPYEVADEQLAQAIQKQQVKFDADKADLEAKMKEKDEEKEKMKKAKEKAEATADAAKSEKLSTDALNTLISDRALLLVDAKNILGDKMPECTDCPLEIKTAVIDHVLPEMKLDGKSKDYIDAAYDVAISKAKKAKVTVDALKKDFETKDKDGKIITRDSAREKYMTGLGLEGK